jgi:hypothetical protein
LAKIYIQNKGLIEEERFCEPSIWEKSFKKWLDLIIMDDKGFNCVQSPEQRALVTEFKHFSVNTLMKYLILIQEEVSKEITKILPNKFGLVIDGWSDGLGTHYCGVFASFLDSKGEKETILLSIAPLIDETNETALNHVNTFTALLKNSYNKEINSVIYITADNANVNKSIADLMNFTLNKSKDNRKYGKYTKFVGCFAHAFNIYCKNILFKPYEMIIELVSTIVSKFKQSNNNCGELLQFTKLKYKQLNITRWSSVYSMLLRLPFNYIDIYIYIL